MVNRKVVWLLVMSPLCTQKWGHIALPLSAQSLTVCAVSLSFITLQWFLSCRWSNTRRWPDSGLMLAHRLRRWPKITQYWVTVSCLALRWMWVSVTDGGPTLTQLWFKALCPYYTASMKYWLGLNGYCPASATPAQHLADIGSVSACNHRQQ